MTHAAIVFTSLPHSVEAGKELGEKILAQLGGEPHAVILFASSRHDYRQLLDALHGACRPVHLMGSSSAGEFTSDSRGEGVACALALRSDSMRFAVGVGRGIGKDREAAAKQVVASFQAADHSFPYRTALVMTDALAGHADDLVEQLTLATSGMHQFVGGGAGDDAAFRRTHVFAGTEVLTDAVVALEILSKKPIGIGVSHGWTPASKGLRVTAASGMVLQSLNGMPAIEAFEEHAQQTGQRLDVKDPLPFFLHNIIGIDVAGKHQLRVPLSVNADGSIACAAEIPVGAVIHVMKTSAESTIDAAKGATRAALARLGGEKVSAALMFDCVATRLRMGDVFGFELKGVSEMLAGAGFAGCNTYGQIARAEGQFGGFHNCTAVVCVFPE